jgi:murein DD-endopeptidase MepM/ murein hydrolase activator NlpD
VSRARRDRFSGLAGSARPGGGGSSPGRALALLLGAVGLGSLAFAAWAGSGKPRAEVVRPATVIGRQTPFSVRIDGGRAGLRSIIVRLEGAAGAGRLFEKEIPADGLLGSGVRSECLDMVLDGSTAGVAEGDARIVVLASDWSPLGRLRGPSEILSVPVTVDLTAPAATPVVSTSMAQRGGSAVVVYRVAAEAVRSGVEVGGKRFPGRTGFFADPTLAVALFAIPQDAEAPIQPQVYAEDAAGNRARAAIAMPIKERKFPSEQIEVTSTFLNVKIPELLERNGMKPPTDPVEAYLMVNRDLRKRTEEKLREIAQVSTPRLLFDGAFVQQPNTAVGSRFAERRHYSFGGRPIDEQTHLGTDLASTRLAPVIASNAGRVLWAGDLGIYGNAVVLDHGLGLESLYAHLTDTAVTPGQMVARGAVVGRSGQTGLAGGDHLHYSTMIDGIHVDPVEWWDGKWFRDRIAPQLAAAPVAGGALPDASDPDPAASTPAGCGEAKPAAAP